MWLSADNILGKCVHQWSEEDESFCDKKRKKLKVKSEFANEKWKTRSESFREKKTKLISRTERVVKNVYHKTQSLQI